MKKFNVNDEYNVYNQKENSLWSNVLVCTKRTNLFVHLEERDEHDNIVATYKRKIRHTPLTEYVYLNDECIVWAD